MPHRQSFGRRQTPGQPQVMPRALTRGSSLSTASREHTPTPGPANGWSTIDPELEEWKQARKSPWARLPWRQLSWVASLCFGIASLVLPADVNSAINWILYALMAASFIAGFRMRAARKNTSGNL